MFQVFVKQVPVQLQINIFNTNHDIEFSSGKHETNYRLTLLIFKFESGWVPVEFKLKRKRTWRYWRVRNKRQGDHFTSYIQSSEAVSPCQNEKTPSSFLIPDFFGGLTIELVPLIATQKHQTNSCRRTRVWRWRLQVPKWSDLGDLNTGRIQTNNIQKYVLFYVDVVVDLDVDVDVVDKTW